MSLRSSSLVRGFVAVAMILAQPCRLLAAPLALPDFTRVPVASVVRMADVELKSGGVLSGQVVDASGANVVGRSIQLTLGQVPYGQQIWKTQTDKEGCFELVGLKGATYRLQVGGQTQWVRAWATGSAPPQASQGLLVLQVSEVVRGQRSVSPNTNQFFRTAKQRLANPLIFGGIVATAVAVPVIVHNANVDEDVPPPATP